MEINLYFIFTRIFQMGITGSIMIAAVLLLRVLLCKAPRRYAYMLWGIVLFRLLCPISWPSVFSVLNLVETPVLENRQADDRFPEERMGENNSPEKIVLQKENMTKRQNHILFKNLGWMLRLSCLLFGWPEFLF